MWLLCPSTFPIFESLTMKKAATKKAAKKAVKKTVKKAAKAVKKVASKPASKPVAKKEPMATKEAPKKPLKQIDSLTPEQEAYLPVFRDKWMERCTQTGRCDRPKVEAALAKLYGAAEKQQPRVIWMDSPHGGCFAASVLEKLNAFSEDQWTEFLPPEFRQEPARSEEIERWWVQLQSALTAQFPANDRPTPPAVVSPQFQKVLDQVMDVTPDNIASQVRHAGYGAHDGYWVAWLRFGEYLGAVLEPHDALEAFDDLCDAGWWWPFEHVVVASERPQLASWDANSRLDSTTGPALQYYDNFALYAIGGVTVDEQIVMRPRTQTTQQIIKEDNAEVRRIRIERYGWENFLVDLKAKRLDHGRNDVDNTLESLYRAELGNQVVYHVLLCVCPSKQTLFAMEVPEAVTTCAGAQEYLSSGLSKRTLASS